MNITRILLASTIVSVVASAAAPTALANTAKPGPAPSTGAANITPFGSSAHLKELRTRQAGQFWAWEHNNGGGRSCSWSDGSSDWSQDCGNFNDTATSILNDRLWGSVTMYKHGNRSGPSMCINRGSEWHNLALGYERFNNGENANDQISSHSWAVGGC